MTTTFTYEPYGVWVAMAQRIDSPDDIWRVRVRHAQPAGRSEFGERQSFFYVRELNPAKWDRIVKVLDRTHNFYQLVGVREPEDEWIVKNCRAPTYREHFEVLLRLIGVEPYWPCCWIGLVDNLMGVGMKAYVSIGSTISCAWADIFFLGQKPPVLFPQIKLEAKLRIHIDYDYRDEIRIIFATESTYRFYSFPKDELSMDALKTILYLGYFDELAKLG